MKTSIDNETGLVLLKDSNLEDVKVSVLLLTKNAGKMFNDLLAALVRQELDCPYEIIMIDSSSTDDTVKNASRYDIKIYQIPAANFGHGKTRNLAARLAKGEIVVYLTQDAIPNNTKWLQNLTERLEKSGAVGCFGRQIPRPGTLPPDRYSYSMDYPDYDFMINKESASGRSVIFSDVNSALKKSVLLRYPYQDEILVSEDVYWANLVMNKGFAIAYSSSGAVIHSHVYKIADIFRINFDQGVGYSQSQAQATSLGGTSMKRFAAKIHHLYTSRHWKWIPYVFFVDALRFLAVFLGEHHKYLPLWLKRRLGKLHFYWSRNDT